LPAGIVAGVCLLLTPFVVFVRYQGYFILRPEILICFALLGIIGVAFGLLMESFGRFSRAPIVAFLVALTFDIQLTDPSPVLLWVVFGLTLVITSLLSVRVWKYTVVVLTVMCAASFLSPASQVGTVVTETSTDGQGTASLPVVLHLVVDEHIGVEGIPQEFDPEGIHAENLRDAYADRGFRVFGRAFSQYYNTWVSLPHVFNFDHTADKDYAIKRTQGWASGFQLTKNRYLNRMQNMGYRIQVYQTEFLEFRESENVTISKCTTYGLETLSSIERSGMRVPDKLRMISGVYSRLSQIMVDLRVPPARLSSLSAMGVIEELRGDLLNATPGDMFLVHIMLPHFPYAYDDECTMREDPWSWLYSHDPDLEPARNNAETRAARYPVYLEQVACTTKLLGDLFDSLREAEVYDDMTIIVHSDHGSRISFRVPHREASGQRLRTEDFIDCYSTLFAVKAPRIRPGYDRRMLPLGPLFEQVVKHGRIPPKTEWAGETQVYLKRSGDPSAVWAMPDFRRKLEPYTPNNTD